MGIMAKVQCRKCGYEENFRLGRGMMNPRAIFYGARGREPLIAIKSPKIREEALSLLKSGGVPDSYGSEIYGCPHCRDLYQKFYFRIVADEKIFEPKYRGSKCGHVLVRLNTALKKDVRETLLGKATYQKMVLKWNCPSCGHERLVANRSGFYD
jgi:rubredoxin